MEADTGLAVPFFLNQQHTSVAGFFPFGRVLYDHGGGLDAPLGVVRMEYSDELRYAQVIAPHATWRGSYDRGTPITGQCLVYNSNGKQLAPPPDSTPATGDQYGGVAGGGTYNGTREHCIEVDWPATYTWSALQYRRGYSGPSSWMGSLIFESRDASGLYYRRNRYYDSEKGRFTQEDPIGLAGGVNVYAFGGGDPLLKNDSYGLESDSIKYSSGDAQGLWAQLKSRALDAQRSRDLKLEILGGLLNGLMEAMESSETNYIITATDYPNSASESQDGGGEGECPYSNLCIARVDTKKDPSRPGGNVGSLTTLAHEIGGVYLNGQGVNHFSSTGAVMVENFARGIFGCRPRRGHADITTGCPY